VNTFLTTEWAERVVRLRLGIEPVDALDPAPGPRGAPAGIAVHLEGVPLPHPLPPRPDDGVGLPQLRRSPSGRFAIVFGSRQTDGPARLQVRILDRAQRHVPRRLSIPAPDLAAVLAAEQGGPRPPRACRPVLLPGSAYGLAAGATTVRGRVTWGSGGPPAQWVRVEVALAGVPAVSWRAHGDRHGEFLLVIGPLEHMQAISLSGVLDVDVTVHARRPPPAQDPVDSPTRSRADPLWHLPVEQVGALVAGDPVTSGAVRPPGYTTTVTRLVQCRRGDVVRPIPFVLT
jgi:hypothetical protein